MPRSPAWRRYLRFWRSDPDADVAEELRFHLESAAAELVARGMAPDAAHAEAESRFGDIGAIRDDLRTLSHNREHTMAWNERWTILGQNLRYGVRRLRRSPGFTAVAVLTLALSLGAATTIFTLLDRVVLRPLPYPHADRLVHIGTLWPKVNGGQEFALSKGQYFFFRSHARTLTDLLLYDEDVMLVPSDGIHPAERVSELEVSANTFHLLGIGLVHGRFFTTADERNPDGDPRVALISYEYWQRRFGGDPRVVGTRIPYGDNTVEIIGVLAPDAHVLDETADVWIRNHLDPGEPPQNNHTHLAIGLLQPGVTVAAAAADIRRVQTLMATQYPDIYSHQFLERSGFAMHVESLSDYVLGDSVGRVLWLLFGGVAVVLLIAAANVANLHLVRIEARQQETAVRTALGASRAQLAWHWITECVLLAIVGGALAMALGWVLLHVVLAIAPQSLPRLSEVALDWRSAAFCVGTALLLGMIFGLLPAASAGALDMASLREGARGLSSTSSRQLARRALVLVQVAFGVVLLSAGGLMARSFVRLQHVDPGFTPAGAQTMVVILPFTRQTSQAQVVEFWHQLTGRLEHVPGVVRAGAGESVPLADGGGCSSLIADGAEDPEHASACMPGQVVTPGYFEALGIRVRGTTPSWNAVEAGQAQAVVTAAFAKRFWPTYGAIDRGIRPFQPTNSPFPIVGIAADLRADGLANPPIEEAFYSITAPPGTPYWQPGRAMYLVVRAPTLSQATVVSAVRHIAGELDRNAVIADVVSMDHIVAKSMARTSFLMLLLLISSALALSLAAAGTYGVIAYVVARRRREIGIRMALGARPRAVARLVLGESLALAATGAIVGVLLSFGTARLLRSQLFEVSPADPLVLGGTAAALVVVAALATLMPMRSATRIDPMEAIRAN